MEIFYYTETEVMEEIKYQAPALAAGVKLLELINRIGSSNLTTLSRASGIGHSSLLRLLATLQQLQLVERQGLNYRALQQIIPCAGALSRQEEITRFVKNISNKLLRTCEWYEIVDGKLTITARAEAENQMIKIRANLGFVRSIDEECEAVLRCAIANKVVIPPVNTHYWCYDNKGAKKYLSNPEFAQFTSAKVAIDMEYNSNGFRRCAVPVADCHGRCIGIVALADSFRPNGDERWQSAFIELQKIVVQEKNNIH